MSDTIIYQNSFVCNDLLLNDGNIQGGVALSQSVNSGDVLTLGSCCMAKAEFSILDLENGIANPTGLEFLYKYEGIQKGYFIVDTAEHIKNVGWKITAYDRMLKFEKCVDTFLETLADSFTLKELFIALCEYIGVPVANTDFTNAELTFYKNFEGTDIKGRDILYWIAEAAGCFAFINTAGNVELKFYDTDSTVTEDKIITNADYIGYSTLESATPLINKLQIRSTEDDIGIIVFDNSSEGNTENNAYIIEGNPLFYIGTGEDSDNGDNREIITEAAENILNKIKGFSYTPFECEMFDGEKVPEISDIISIKTPDGDYINSFVMHKTQNGMRVLLSATGSTDTNNLTSLNLSIKQKNNKTNELKRTIDSTVLKVTEISESNNTLQSIIEQNSTSISACITKTVELENSQTELKNKTDGIENTINNGVSKVVTTSVVIDESGITVGNTDKKMKTQMTPDAFKVLDEKNDERINVSSEGTKLQKTIIEDDLTVGAVKMIKLENGVDFVFIGGDN